ncbi:MAG: hypothetical protein OXC39_03800 [Candidatus Dadabacteria bacterium]|nr:hypothetical protein [Candidatus Dadabacteria bacterium]
MPEEKSQNQLEQEKELRRRLKILQEKFEKGQIRFREGLAVKESLMAVKTGPDGEIDLGTVDGLVRALASTAAILHDREELKKIASLDEIQSAYFELVEPYFGPFYDHMAKKGLSPHDAGMTLKQNPQFVKGAIRDLDQVRLAIDEFWEKMGEIAHAHVEDMHGNIKGVFGGDLFPAPDENIVSKCGVYTDTIILPDPFLRSRHVFEHYPEEEHAYYLMKHGLSILQYRQIACADIGTPIVAILPDRTALEKGEREFCTRLGEDDSLIHSEKLFGRKFESAEELSEFAQSLDTVEKAVTEIKDESRVLFDTSWREDISTQLQKALEDPDFNLQGNIKSPGEILTMTPFGRMFVSNELLIKSRRLNGTPIIEAPTSWRYLVWKMEYDALRAERETGAHDLHVVRGLQELAGNEMEWLGNIPIDALIEIRREGAMEEIREILGKGVNDLVNSNPDNFHRSRDRVFDNIHQAFAQHQEEIKNLREKKWKFAGKHIGSFLVKGPLEIAAAATGTPLWGLPTIAAIVADELLDMPKLKDIPQSIRDLAAETDKIHKSPVGMLFSVSKSKRKA